MDCLCGAPRWTGGRVRLWGTALEHVIASSHDLIRYSRKATFAQDTNDGRDLCSPGGMYAPMVYSRQCMFHCSLFIIMLYRRATTDNSLYVETSWYERYATFMNQSYSFPFASSSSWQKALNVTKPSSSPASVSLSMTTSAVAPTK